MLKLLSTLSTITAGNHKLQLYIPDPESVKKFYQGQPPGLAYWSQVWPAALGLCEFLTRHTALIKDKNVIELAAGLGLPSLLASKYADSVMMSDYLPEAVQLMQQTIDHNQSPNLHCSLLDWNDIPQSVNTDVLLLSDVNYAPELFNKVFEVILRFLNAGTLVILSTPQRLMAKPFIIRLLPFIQEQEEISAERNGAIVPVSILVLSGGEKP